MGEVLKCVSTSHCSLLASFGEGGGASLKYYSLFFIIDFHMHLSIHLLDVKVSS